MISHHSSQLNGEHIPDRLPLMECFSSIQGEGYHQGNAVFFIRLGGCDVGCHWCDTKESWNTDNFKLMSAQSIANLVPKEVKTVVVSGGEPTMWSLDKLTFRLKTAGFKIHLETSGAYSTSGKWDWVCLSPKKNKLPKKEWYSLANELKVIIHNRHDLVFAIEQARLTTKECQLFVQPEWGKVEQMVPHIVDFVLKNPKWRISTQLHKYLKIA